MSGIRAARCAAGCAVLRSVLKFQHRTEMAENLASARAGLVVPTRDRSRTW